MPTIAPVDIPEGVATPALQLSGTVRIMTTETEEGP